MLLNKFLRFSLGPIIGSTFINVHGHWKRRCILYKLPSLRKEFVITLSIFFYFLIFKSQEYVLRNPMLLMCFCQLLVFLVVFISCILMLCYSKQSFILLYVPCAFCPLSIKYGPFCLVPCTLL